MIFDGLFIHHLLGELNATLNKSRLEKIVQTDESSFLFILYAKGERHYLNLSVSPHHYGIFLTKKQTTGQESSQFQNTLKRHIEGGILEQFFQYKTDRVIVVRFTVYDMIDGPVTKELIFEAMGRHSNLLLVKDGIILDTFKKMFFEEGRQLLPQAQFEYFPSDKAPFTEIDYTRIKSPKDLVDHYLGISPFLANYLDEHPVQVLSIPVKPTRSITQNKDYVADIFPVSDEKMYFHSISEMMDAKIEFVKPVNASLKQFIIKQIQKLEKKDAQFDDMFHEASLRLEDRSKGDALYQSGLDLSQKMSSFEGSGQVISLDPTKTLNEHAQAFFKSYQKGKRSLKHIEHQRMIHLQMKEHLEDLLVYADMATPDSLKELEAELLDYGYKSSRPEKSSGKQKRKPGIIRIPEGDITYYIGKNNLQNEYVTHELAQKDDLWFHVKDGAGAHVVVTVKTLTEPVLRKAAMLAAYFSSMRKSSSIPVDYTRIRHLKKIPGLPGYRVTYKHHQTIYIDVDEALIESYLKNV